MISANDILSVARILISESRSEIWKTVGSGKGAFLAIFENLLNDRRIA